MKTTKEKNVVPHPGEELGNMLKTLDMPQKELAVRTSFSEKHISEILSGKKGISPLFAKRLEYALGKPARDWLDEQSMYDHYVLEEKERNEITEEETAISKRLHDIVLYLEKISLIHTAANSIDAILELRKFMGVSNLCNISEITYNAAYRTQLKSNYKIDPYVLFAWQRMCEKLTERIEISDCLNIEQLKKSIPDIKQLMFCKGNEIQTRLNKLFAACGIAFSIVRHFTGAPVQGFIKELQNGRMILCITLRQKRQDIFWFTLFHEIAHIIYGDAKQRFVDFTVKSDVEARADEFAGNILIDSGAYREFVAKRSFTDSPVHSFAMSQGVPDHIVKGRLLHDELLPYNAVRLPQYEWAQG